MKKFKQARVNGGSNYDSLVNPTLDCKPDEEHEEGTKHDLWAPIVLSEIKAINFSGTTAPGPDGLDVKQFRSIPNEVLLRIFNILMVCGEIPEQLRESSTTLIPKSLEAKEPGDYRPITVSPILLRAFHKVLAARLSRLLPLDNRQRAFRTFDGCGESTFLLDFTLRYHHRHYRPLYMASIDVAKAFDSVSHSTVLQTLKIRGAPVPFTRYIGSVYESSWTRLKYGATQSTPILPTCGVKQGDPLSPWLFNLVIDRLLNRIPSGIGVNMQGLKINAMAFADDIILLASTKDGLQQSLDITSGFLNACGLLVNANKCISVAIRTVPHLKKTAVETKIKFCIGGRTIPSLRRTEEFKYLGVPFTADGRTTSNPVEAIGEALAKLSKAPLRPQQRLFVLRVHLLPKVFHVAALGCIRIGVLNKVDRLVRKAVRRWLSLPDDAPNAYFHAAIRDGGLGIVAMRWNGPLLRYRRLRDLEAGEGERSLYREEEIKLAERRLRPDGVLLQSKEGVERRWAGILYATVDGAAFRDSSKTIGQNTWVGDGSSFVSGRDFVNFMRLRINAMPTRSRLSRGRRRDRACRAGCGCIETTNHVLQICHRTHGMRIKRHDAVAHYIGRGLANKGYTVELEPVFETVVGRRKPDVIATKDDLTLVIDAQVVSEHTDLDAAHRRKTNYYQDNLELRENITSRCGSREVRFTSATLSWRGIWSAQSARQLVEYSAVKKADLKIVSTRVLLGGVAAFRFFNRTTSVRGVIQGVARQGIG